MADALAFDVINRFAWNFDEANLIEHPPLLAAGVVADALHQLPRLADVDDAAPAEQEIHVSAGRPRDLETTHGGRILIWNRAAEDRERVAGAELSRSRDSLHH